MARGFCRGNTGGARGMNPFQCAAVRRFLRLRDRTLRPLWAWARARLNATSLRVALFCATVRRFLLLRLRAMWEILLGRF